MKKNSLFIYYSIAVGTFLSLFIFSSYNGKDSIANSVGGLFRADRIRSFNLNKNFIFASEAIPMDNFDAKERLDREILVNTYKQAATILNIKLANRYFPLMEKILAEKGVPDDFKFLAVAESELRNVKSPAGAKGIWQFMNGVAQQYGLEVNAEVDERFHLEKSTEAACKLLLDNKKKFGSWLLAAAAYNMGAFGLEKEMNEQRANTYYEVSLNEETSRYVFRLVAMKEILEHPKDYGFFVEDDHLYEPLTDYAEIAVDTPVPNWGDFANKYGISYRILRVYNPWIIGTKLSNASHKTYYVRIPKK